MSERSPAARSAAPEGFGLLWAAPRGALSPRLLVPAWLFTALSAGAHVGLADSRWGWALWPAAGLGGLLGACWVSAFAAHDLRLLDRPSWRAHAALALRAFRCSFLAGAAYLITMGLLVAVAASTLLLRWIPFAGQALYAAAVSTVGLGAAILAALLLAAAPLFFALLAPCAALETPQPVAAFMTCWSYVRRRPLRCLLGLLSVALSALLALVPAALVLALAAGGLRSIHVLGEGAAAVPADLAADAARFLAPGGNPLRSLFAGPDGWARALLASALAAFGGVSLAAGWSRLFLLLRREVDGVDLDARREEARVDGSRPGAAAGALVAPAG